MVEKYAEKNLTLAVFTQIQKKVIFSILVQNHYRTDSS